MYKILTKITDQSELKYLKTLINRSQRKKNIVITKAVEYCFVWFMVFNATFNNVSAISWRPVLLVDESGVP